MDAESSAEKRNIFDKILDAMAYLAGVVLILITLIVAFSVTIRYLQIRPPIWVLQFTEYGLLWITFLGAAWVLRLDGHIRIDTVISQLPKSVQNGLDVLNSILGCAVTLTIIYFGCLHTADLFQREILEVKAVNVSKYLVFFIIPFGSLLLFLQFLRDTWQKISKMLGR